MIIYLPLTCSAIFFSMELLIGYFTTLPLEKGKVGKRMYVMRGGGRNKLTCAYDGGLTFCHFGVYALNE